jgi:hypothetical protein
MDPIMTSFFMPTSNYDKLADTTKDKLKGLYAITAEPITASRVVKRYWTTLCDTVVPCQVTNDQLLPIEDFTYDSGVQYTVLRPTALLSEIFDQQQIIHRIENHPITSVSFYNPSESVAMEDRHSVIPTEVPRGFTVVKTTVVYELEELAPLQLDYVNELFAFVWQRIFDEQEEAYAEDDFNRGRLPSNSLVGQFVSTVGFERYQDDCYLVFTYDRFQRVSNNNNKLSKSEVGESNQEETVKPMLTGGVELPLEIEILASIPLAEDDTDAISLEDQEYLTIDDDGDQAVSFYVHAALRV